ncbi:MAG: glycosyltransferase [Mycolicibacterium insubricum]
MKFAFASYGTRGDIEPSVCIAHELQRRGHQVRLAVPPDLVDFVEATDLATVPYGPRLQEFMREDLVRDLWTEIIHNPLGALRELWEPIATHWNTASTTLEELARGADVLSTGLNFEQAAANVAEHYNIPLVALHHFPMRPNAQLAPSLPGPLVRATGVASDWLMWRTTRDVENAQRHALNLPTANHRSTHRMAERRTLEIQAYDVNCFPGLATEWARFGDRRPFTGALTMELDTDEDAGVAAWIEAGQPPICFATGSIAVASPADTIRLFAAACEELGQRALICAGGTDFSGITLPSHVKVVGAVNYSTVFPKCRAVVHHGGAGTTAASLRAGIPTLILWSTADQPYWGNQVKRLGVGTARRACKTTARSLAADLGKLLSPDYASRAGEFASRMTTSTQSATHAADLFEGEVHR